MFPHPAGGGAGKGPGIPRWLENKKRNERDFRLTMGRTEFLRCGGSRSWSVVETFPSFPRSRLGKNMATRVRRG